MRTYLSSIIFGSLIVLTLGAPIGLLAQAKPNDDVLLTDAGQKLQLEYAAELEKLRDQLSAQLPKSDKAQSAKLDKFLSSDSLDDKLAKFVVMHEATPEGLAKFAQQGKQQKALVEKLLGDADLMTQMLVADGANAKRQGRGYGAPEYGPAMQIYTDIQKGSMKATNGVLHRLALAISLEHSVPITQTNPVDQPNAPKTVDPVKRYFHYEKAFENGELDPAFERLSTWELRMVVNGDEPDETLAWGRKMLRNYRPDHIYNDNYGWRYVNLVGSDVKYGSGDVKYDRPELQKYQNILMNGGVCGRRAFIGRFILRAFGIPTTARPSRGHAALAHWTPAGWVVNLGGGWGAGWTSTRYKSDLDFLASTQARPKKKEYLKVKRAQWAGDLLGEKRSYGEHEDNPEFWNGLALTTQRAIIESGAAVTLDALGEDLGESNEPTVA
ncbi:hypothetical protein N9009_02405, partial [bacterium]|nr:hypothetical protein [bacterium]